MSRMLAGYVALAVLLGSTLFAPGLARGWGRWSAAVAVAAESVQREDGPFLFYLPDPESTEAAALMDAAVRARAEVAGRLGAWPEGWRHQVVQLEDRQAMSRRLGLPAGRSALGAYHRSTVWIRADADPYSSLVHEFTHEWLDLAGRGRLPDWFHEGVAQWVAYRATGYEWREPGADPSDPGVEPYSFERLSKEFAALQNRPLAYRQSFLAVKALAARLETGDDPPAGGALPWIAEAAREAGRGRPVEETLAARLGEPLKEFLREPVEAARRHP